MVSIVVMGPPAAGSRFPLGSKHEFVIGRSGFCDIVLNKRSISREHARIFEKNGEYFIEDLESLNGTSVNGRPIQGITRLVDGARINLHDVPLSFHLFDDVRPPSSGTIAVFTGSQENGSETRLQTKLDDLLDIIRRLGSNLNVDVILPKVLDILFHTFPQAINGEILLVESHGNLSPRATKHGREADTTAVLTSVPPDRQMTQKVMETNTALIESVGDDSHESVLESTFSSTMYVPIIGLSRAPLGIIVLETEDADRRFVEEDLNLVSGVAMMAAQAISYARAHEMSVEYERTRYHLQTAREIQLRMLPRDCPSVPGYSFAHFYNAAQMVGGDAYIYHTLPDGRVVAAVADASGKGLPASLRIVEFISELRHCFSTAVSLKSAMEYLNRQVCLNEDGFITFCVAVVDPRRHTLSIANAGHPPPRLRRCDGSVIAVEPGRVSFPLGLVPDAQFHAMTISLNVGEDFVLFTDGVTEAFDCDGALYGIDRLHLALQAPAESAELRVQQLMNHIDVFRRGSKPSDDVCIVVVRRNPDSTSASN
jgi:sigma-B regulation protein RsbU (phosphoserine phosphatase)